MCQSRSIAGQACCGLPGTMSFGFAARSFLTLQLLCIEGLSLVGCVDDSNRLYIQQSSHVARPYPMSPAEANANVLSAVCSLNSVGPPYPISYCSAPLAGYRRGLPCDVSEVEPLYYLCCVAAAAAAVRPSCLCTFQRVVDSLKHLLRCCYVDLQVLAVH